MKVYYNEIEPFAVAWLRELIKDGQIPDGEVDERSIADVRPDDLRGFDQCHFFAGIGGWPYALSLAGWDGPVWTGSCPCQPFSGAGKRKGLEDSRHLWPTWFRLIRECCPPVVFGEQVASPDGLAWLDIVSTDLEAEGYAVGAADLCAAGVGAPHIRQRLYFVADHNRERREGEWLHVRERGPRETMPQAAGSGSADLVADSRRAELRGGCGSGGPEDQRERSGTTAGDRGTDGVMGDARQLPTGRRSASEKETRQGASSQPTGSSNARILGDSSGAGLAIGQGDQERRGAVRDEGQAAAAPSTTSLLGEPCSGAAQEIRPLPRQGPSTESGGSSALADSDCSRRAADGAGLWSDLVWLPCSDGKARPTQPGIFPLAHGVPNRLGTLRGAGNAIVPQVAAEFVKAVMEVNE